MKNRTGCLVVRMLYWNFFSICLVASLTRFRRNGIFFLSFCQSSVPVSEASIIIAVSSAHRAESLQAVSYAIDTLKAKVPIWKKVRKYLFLPFGHDFSYRFLKS